MEKFENKPKENPHETPEQKAFRELDQFTRVHGGYSLDELLPESLERLAVVEGFAERVKALPPSDYKDEAAHIIQYLKSPAFTDKVSDSIAADKQREIRSKAADEMGNRMRGGKKAGGLTSVAHKHFEEMNDFLKSNRLRRSKALQFFYKHEGRDLFFEGHTLDMKDDTKGMLESLLANEYKVVPFNGRDSRAYDHMTTKEKITAEERFSQFLMAYLRDITEYLETHAAQT